MKKKTMLAAVMAVTVLAGSAVTAVAAGAESAGTYGYLTGQRQSQERRGQFQQLETFSTDEERADFFAKNGLGGAYGSETQLDVEALAEAGVIDQQTAQAIADYASDKHSRIHSRYADMDTMTAAERRTAFAGVEREDSDPVQRLLDAGVLTQAQADAVNAWLSGQA